MEISNGYRVMENYPVACCRSPIFWRSAMLKTRGKFVCSVAGLFLFLCAGTLFAAGPRITEKAVFVPGQSLIDTARTTCSGEEGLMPCYVKLLRNAGAPDDAVRFVKLTDEPGYLRKLKKVGPVDIAFVEFPFRANENAGVFLVNGTPEMINVDDLSAIGSSLLDANPAYAALKKQYPDISLFMGDRFSEDAISVERPKTGKLIFTVPYRLSEGCRACEDVGEARVVFSFDTKGTFEGRKLRDVRPVKK